MKLERFKVERWMDEYEGFLTYDLGETCIDSLEVGELLELCGKDPDCISVRAERGETGISDISTAPLN